MRPKLISVVFAVEFIFSILILRLYDLLDLRIIISVGVPELGIAILVDYFNKRSEERRIEREESNKQRDKLEQEKNKEIEYKNEENNTIKRLLLEIEANQLLLQPIYKMVKAREDDIESAKDDKLPKMLSFIQNNYFKELGKLEFLEKDLRTKLTQYHSELKYIEEEYKKLDTFHGQSHSYIIELNLRALYQPDEYKSTWIEIERFLVNTKKVYDLGEDLISDLKK